jgi:plastocyanin
VDLGLPLPKLQVFRDSTVTWTNRSGVLLGIAVPGAEPSGVLDPEVTSPPAMALSPGQRFSHTFELAGPTEYTVTQTQLETTPVTDDPMPALTGTVDVIEPIELVDFGVFAIEPPLVKIAAGARVGWINRDAVAHTITADALDFATGSPVYDTGPIAPGAVSLQVFPTPGEFTYRCTAHPEHASIEGKIVVEPAPETGDEEAFQMLGALPATRSSEASAHTSGGGSS